MPFQMGFRAAPKLRTHISKMRFVVQWSTDMKGRFSDRGLRGSGSTHELPERGLRCQ